MRENSLILPTRSSANNPVRLGRRRRLWRFDFRARAALAGRHHALADASRPAWLSAPLFSRHQPPPSVAARHA